MVRTLGNVNLNAIAATNYHGCLGLPQELIDHILDMLRDDFRSLKACSLTCKAMFASTRPLIHQTLYLTVANNQSILTRREKEKLRASKTDYNRLALRFVSHMGERGLFQYTRRIYILYFWFTPHILLPHLRHFQTLDRVHTLTIEFCSSRSWRWGTYHKTCFVHFYPTLTSLTIRCPVGNSQSILQFALQFPNLENLSLERVERPEWSDLCWPDFNDFDRPPPLCGNLRLAGCETIEQWPVDPAHQLSSIVHFRSVELMDFLPGAPATHILNTCAHNLEDLTVVPHITGSINSHSLPRPRQNNWLTFLSPGQLMLLDFTKLTILRRFTLRVPPAPSSTSYVSTLLSALSTIVSPAFRELVFELSHYSSPFSGLSPEDQDQWRGVDNLLEERFAERGDFRVVVRSSERCDSLTFEGFARDNFPLMANRGCIHFETSHS